MRQEIEGIFEAIGDVCVQNGIDRASVRVLAATKTVDAARINRLPDCGVTLAGENRVQEFLEKYDSVHGLDWHFIGALQTNKVKYIIDKVSMIHSLDRESLADEIDAQAARRGICADVLLEVNAGGEASKSGVSLEAFERLYDYCAEKKNVRMRGVMSVLPKQAPETLYDTLYAVFSKKRGGSFDTLSAGMSNDYLTAIKHGANLVRLGSIIFGKRT